MKMFIPVILLFCFPIIAEEILLEETVIGANGNISIIYKYEYDQDNNLLFKRTYKPNNLLDSYHKYIYSGTGLLIEKTNIDVYRKGETKGAYVFPDSGEKIIGYTKYEYDKEGKLIQEDNYYSDDSIYETITYEYDESSRIVKKKYENKASDNHLPVNDQIIINQYVEGKLYKSLKYDKNYNLVFYSVHLYEYNSETRKFNEKRIIQYRINKWLKNPKDDFIVSGIIDKVYDSNDNLITSEVYNIDSYILTFNNKIEYIYYENQ